MSAPHLYILFQKHHVDNADTTGRNKIYIYTQNRKLKHFSFHSYTIFKVTQHVVFSILYFLFCSIFSHFLQFQREKKNWILNRKSRWTNITTIHILIQHAKFYSKERMRMKFPFILYINDKIKYNCTYIECIEYRQRKFSQKRK